LSGGVPHRSRSMTLPVPRSMIFLCPPASRKTTPSICAGSRCSRYAATSRLFMPVTSAPQSMSALTGGCISASSCSTPGTSQSAGSMRDVTTAGLVSVRSIFASSPIEWMQAPISSGSSEEGVPEKAMRREKSISPPRSWPLADSFARWCAVVSGKTMWSR